jgi:hypothetical protein
MSRIQNTRTKKSAQVHSSDWIWAASEYQNFWNWNFQLVSDTDLYDHSDLSAALNIYCLVLDLLLVLHSHHSNVLNLVLLCFNWLKVQIFLSVSQHSLLYENWCVTTFNDDDDEEMTINQYSEENFILTRFLKRAWWNWISEFTQILKWTHRSEPVSFATVRITKLTVYKMQMSLLILLTWLIRQISRFLLLLQQLKTHWWENDESHACYLHRKKLAATAEFQVRLLWSDA